MRGRLFLLLAAVAATVLLAAILIWRFLPRKLDQAYLKPREEVVDLTSVVTRVRELSRLETASMRVVHVSTISQSYKLLPDSLAGDELTLVATGDVIAGVDLSRLTVADVWRQPNGAVGIRLPPPQILVTRVDNRETHVVTRKTGVLRRADMQLEGRARENAEMSIRSEAVRRGILKLAAGNAEKKLADFLHTLGYQQVRFESQRVVRSE